MPVDPMAGQLSVHRGSQRGRLGWSQAEHLAGLEALVRGPGVEWEEGSVRRAASLVDNSVVLGGPWLCAGGLPRGRGQAAALRAPWLRHCLLLPSERPLSGRVFVLPAPALCVLLAHLRMRWQQVCAL